MSVEHEGNGTRGAFLSEKELAKRWGIAPGTLRNHRSARKGCRWTVLGQRTVRYALADVVAFELVGASKVAA